MNIHFSCSTVKSGNFSKDARKAILGIETVVDRALKLAREGKSTYDLHLTSRQDRQFAHQSLTSSSASAIKAANARLLRPKVVYASQTKGQIAEVVQAYCVCSGCPSTWEGITTDDCAIYARFRFGQLSVRLGSPGDNKEEMAGCEGTTVLVVSYGGEFAGTIDFATLKEITKGRVKWPDTTG